MSVSSLVDLAVSRGTGTPEQSQRYANEGDTPKPVDSKTPVGLAVIVSAIPVEIVTLYTAFAAGVATTSTPSTEFLAQYEKDHGGPFPFSQTTELVGVRWSVYLALALCTIALVYGGWRRGRDTTKDERKSPISEMAAGAAAFLVWGLVMPSGLLAPYVETDRLSAVTLAIITVAAAVLVAFGLGVLKNGVSKK